MPLAKSQDCPDTDHDDRTDYAGNDRTEQAIVANIARGDGVFDGPIPLGVLQMMRCAWMPRPATWSAIDDLR